MLRTYHIAEAFLDFVLPRASGWLWSLDVPVVLGLRGGLTSALLVWQASDGYPWTCVSESIGLDVSVTTGPMKVGKERIGEWRSAWDTTLLRAPWSPSGDSESVEGGWGKGG